MTEIFRTQKPLVILDLSFEKISVRINLMIIVMSLFSKTSVFEMFLVHAKTVGKPAFSNSSGLKYAVSKNSVFLTD